MKSFFFCMWCNLISNRNFFIKFCWLRLWKEKYQFFFVLASLLDPLADVSKSASGSWKPLRLPIAFVRYLIRILYSLSFMKFQISSFRKNIAFF